MAPNRMNFGAVGNDQLCDCGRHRGVGELSPGDRAARYKHMAEIMPNLLSAQQREYLTSWEKAHGPVRFVMETRIAEGHFLRKGEEFEVPVCTSYQQPPAQQRSMNWHGD